MADPQGTIFDIREWCLHDGPGVRTTVFFKGCPLRCLWCHNPESQDMRPERMFAHDECLHCGQCRAVCPSPDQCIRCGRCASACPARRIRMVGRVLRASELAARLLLDRDILSRSDGGVTFSGGEPLAQPEFLFETARLLSPIHLAIETCGHAAPEVYATMLQRVSLVFQDIKAVTPALHRRLTGVSNDLILANLQHLQASGKPFIARLPLVPGHNDATPELEAAARLLARNRGGLLEVQLLPYQSAGLAKYRRLGRESQLALPSPLPQPNPDAQAIFRAAGLPCAWPFGDTVA